MNNFKHIHSLGLIRNLELENGIWKKIPEITFVLAEEQSSGNWLKDLRRPLESLQH